jgi:hypothetical protein
MAIPEKVSRKIVVSGNHYTWVASGNDGFIALTICDSEVKGQKLLAQLDYYSRQEAGRSTQGLSITPAVVEQVINYGLTQGWVPKEREKDLKLYSIDDKLEFPIQDL